MVRNYEIRKWGDAVRNSKKAIPHKGKVFTYRKKYEYAYINNLKK